jgi:hypothetical protein
MSAHDLGQFLWSHRLNKVIHHTLLHEVCRLLEVTLTRHHDHRNGGKLLSEIRDSLLPIMHLRHVDVAQDRIDRNGIVTRANLLNSLLAIFGIDHIVTGFREREPNRFPYIFLLIDNPYGSEHET